MASVIEHQTVPTPSDVSSDAGSTGHDRHDGRRWWRPVAASVAAIALLGVGLVLGRATSDGGGGDGDAAVMAPIDAFNTAWEEHDADGILAVTTDDFVEEYRYFGQLDDGRMLYNDESWSAEQASSYAVTGTYLIDLVGDPVVVGDGPWFVTVAERQSGGGYEYDGTASYVVVEGPNGLELAQKLWVGARELVRDD